MNSLAISTGESPIVLLRASNSRWVFCTEIRKKASDDSDALRWRRRGIEPASRDASMKASTCVANGLVLARQALIGEATPQASGGSF